MQTARRLYHMKCPECGGWARNYRSTTHLQSTAHRLGRVVREMFSAGKQPPEVAEKLGMKMGRLSIVMVRLGITSWKGKKKNKDLRGPRAAVHVNMEELAVELEARGMLVEAAMTASTRGHGSRIYVNGRRCAVTWPNERPKHFEDEAPVVIVRRPLRQDWEFLIVVTSYGRLVLNKQECPLTNTQVAVASGHRSGFVTQNWKAKLEAWDKIKPVRYSRPLSKVGVVEPQDSRGLHPVVVVKKYEEDDVRDAQRAVEETVNPPALPSAQDLDAVAEEVAVREATQEDV